MADSQSDSVEHVFFTIFIPEEWSGTERAWADQYWDTYGFDYDTERCSLGRIVAWPYNDEEDETLACEQLKLELEDADIAYETFEATYDSLFGPLHDGEQGQ